MMHWLLVGASLLALGSAIGQGTSGKVALTSASANWSDGYYPGNACYAWDSDNATVYVFHGKPPKMLQYNILTGTNQSWSGWAAASAPTGRGFTQDAEPTDNGPCSMLIYVAKWQRVVLFGGYDSESQQVFQDTWVFNPSGNTWTAIANTLSTPSGRGWPGFTIDQQGVIYMFGGLGQGLQDEGLVRLQDTATLTLTSSTSGTWAQFPTSTPPSARTAPAMAISGNQLYLFGGCVNGVNGAAQLDAGLYFLSLPLVANKAWTSVGFTAAGGPVGRQAFNVAPFLAVYAATGTMYMGPANIFASGLNTGGNFYSLTRNNPSTANVLESSKSFAVTRAALFIAQKQARAYFIQGSAIEYYQIADASCATAVTCPPGQSPVTSPSGNELNFATCCGVTETTTPMTTSTVLTTTSETSTSETSTSETTTATRPSTAGTTTVTVTTTSVTSTVTGTTTTVTTTVTGTTTLVTTTVTGTTTTVTTTVTGTTTTVTTTVTGTTTTATTTVTSTATTVTMTATGTATTVTATATGTTTSVTTTATGTTTSVTTTVTGSTTSVTTTVTSSTTLVTTTVRAATTVVTTTGVTAIGASPTTVTETTTSVTTTTMVNSSTTPGAATPSETKVTSVASTTSQSVTTWETNVTSSSPSGSAATTSTSSTAQCIDWRVPSALVLPGQEIQALAIAQSNCLDPSAVNVSLLDSVSKEVGTATARAAVIILRQFGNGSGLPSDLASALAGTSLIGRRLYVLSVAAGVTQRGSSYRLKLQSLMASAGTFVSPEFHTDLGPFNGHVAVAPLSGEAVSTVFNISTHWEAAPMVLPLSYCFFQRPANSSQPWLVISAWSASPNRSLLLSEKLWEVGVQAQDSLGLAAAALAVSAPVLVTAAKLDVRSAVSLLATSQASSDGSSFLNALQVVAESAAGPGSGLATQSLASAMLDGLAAMNTSGSKDVAVQKAWVMRNLVTGLQLNASSAMKATNVLSQNVDSLSSNGTQQMLLPEEAQHFAVVLTSLASTRAVTPGDNRTRLLANLAGGVAGAMAQGLLGSTTDCAAEGNPVAVTTTVPGLVLAAARIPMSKQGATIAGLPASSIPQSVMDLAKASLPVSRCGQTVGAVSTSWRANPYSPLQMVNATAGQATPVDPLGSVVSLSMLNSKGEKLQVTNLSLPLPMVIPLRSPSSAPATATHVSEYQDFERRFLQWPSAAPECRWWDANLGSWSTQGCRVMSVARNGGELRCSCTHLTDFGAFPGPLSSAAFSAIDLLDLLGDSLLQALTCAKVQVFEAAGMARLLAGEWQLRPSTASFWVLMGLVFASLLTASAFDVRNRFQDSSLDLGAVAELADREIAQDPVQTPRGLCGVWAAVQGFFCRNKLWRARVRLQSGKRVLAMKLKICPETLDVLLAAEEEAEGPLPAEMQETLQKVLRKSEQWGLNFQKSLEEVQFSLRKQSFLGRALTLARAVHPLQALTCSSLYSYHTVRALLTLAGLTGAIALSALLDSSETLTYDSPDSCVTPRDYAFVAGSVLQAVGSALIPVVVSSFFRLAGPKRQLGRSGSWLAFWAKMGLSLLFGAALVAFFLLYVALYLANVYPSMATYWILTGFVVCSMQFLVLVPIVRGFVLAPVFDWFPTLVPKTAEGKVPEDTIVDDLTTGSRADAVLDWQGVVPAQKSTAPLQVLSLPGALEPLSEEGDEIQPGAEEQVDAHSYLERVLQTVAGPPASAAVAEESAGAPEEGGRKKEIDLLLQDLEA